MRQAALGEQELAILRFIAETGPVTVGEAVENYGMPAGLARSTVLTMMERLRKKGYLQRVKSGGAFQYVSSKPRAELLQSIVGDFVDRALAGSVSPFVAYLSEARELSDLELTELHDLVDRLDAKRRANTGGN